MKGSTDTQTRWVIKNPDSWTVDTVKALAIRHHVPIAEVLAEAVLNFDSQLGRHIELPEGWTKPRDW